MRELTARRWIVAKGAALLAIALTGGALLLAEAPSPRTAVLLAVVVWAACRFYYFLFYVLERYVDPRLRYSGLTALLRAVLTGRGR